MSDFEALAKIAQERGDEAQWWLLKLAAGKTPATPTQHDVLAAKIVATIQSLTEELDALTDELQNARTDLAVVLGDREGLRGIIAKQDATVDTLRAVEKAARVFAAQPGVRLAEPFESAWLGLVDALAALTTKDREGEP